MRTPAAAAVLSLLLLGACSPLSQPPEDAKREDYRQMIEHARQRRAAEETLQTVRGAAQKFHVDLGRFPATLDELVALKYLDRLPEPPQGTRFVYNEELGNIALAKEPAQLPSR